MRTKWLTRCRVCGCTEVNACAGGCSWVEKDLCSTCAVAVEGLIQFHLNAQRANMAALNREVDRRLEDWNGYELVKPLRPIKAKEGA